MSDVMRGEGLFNVLKSVVSLFAGPDLYDILDVIDKYLAVADMSGIKDLLRGFDDRSDRNL